MGPQTDLTVHCSCCRYRATAMATAAVERGGWVLRFVVCCFVSINVLIEAFSAIETTTRLDHARNRKACVQQLSLA